MKKVLHVWSRVKCKWVVWRGSYAAWKALPHAAVICCCAAVTVTAVHQFAAAGLPGGAAPARPTVPQTPPPPAALRLATLGIIPYDPRHSLTHATVQPQEVGGVSAALSCASCASAPIFLPPPPVQSSVPEPGSLSLFASGVLALTLAALARRRRQARD
ncbi:MAG: PEP-CTERM sorting domain-containing protein [Steroidobacteraceae bacterium]